MRRLGLLLALASTPGGVACRSKEAPAVADRPAPSPSTVASASSSITPVADSLDALDCTDGVIENAHVPSSPSAGFGLRMDPRYHVLGSIADAPLIVADPLARAICAVLPKVRACYAVAEKAHAALVGELAFEVKIDAGHTTSIGWQRGSVADPTLTKCAYDALTGLVLPPDVPSSSATYTLRFLRVAPSVRIRDDDTTILGDLPSDTVKRILHESFPRFRACYEQGLETQPTLAGTVKTHAIIEERGAIVRATSTGGTLPNVAVAECIRRVFPVLTFPKPSSGTVTIDSVIFFTTE